VSRELRLDIFFANDLLAPVHVGKADDLESARMRMGLLAAETPGWYFVWDAAAHRVVARIDTTRPEGIRAQTDRCVA